MDKLTMLKKARENLSDPAGWTQGTYFRGEGGRPLLYENVKAGRSLVCSRCADGALIEVTFNEISGPYHATKILERELANASHAFVNGGLIGWNDKLERTHAEVLAVFDAAIARLEGEGERFTPDALTDTSETEYPDNDPVV